jgi:hypothetical protein
MMDKRKLRHQTYRFLKAQGWSNSAAYLQATKTTIESIKDFKHATRFQAFLTDNNINVIGLKCHGKDSIEYVNFSFINTDKAICKTEKADIILTDGEVTLDNEIDIRELKIPNYHMLFGLSNLRFDDENEDPKYLIQAHYHSLSFSITKMDFNVLDNMINAYKKLNA